MKLKNIESIEELKVGDVIYDNSRLRKGYTILAKCEGAVMVYTESNEWFNLAQLDCMFNIEDKSSEWVPKHYEIVWIVDFTEEDTIEGVSYNDEYSHHKRLLRRGLMFKTKEEAIDCAKKMLEAIKK